MKNSTKYILLAWFAAGMIGVLAKLNNYSSLAGILFTISVILSIYLFYLIVSYLTRK